jgi:E3 ubiquitin-protein ligase DOA10
VSIGLILFKKDSNQLEIDKEANSIKQKDSEVKQFDYRSSIYAQQCKYGATQQGNNQNIQNFGSNSISENGFFNLGMVFDYNHK